jgi:hypothetical protein
VICDRPDLTLQAVLANQLRRIRHALIFIIVAVATAAEWELNSNGSRSGSGSGCRLSCRKSKIKLRRNDQAQDWSIEINGLLHEHVSSEIMEDLVSPSLGNSLTARCEDKLDNLHYSLKRNE